MRYTGTKGKLKPNNTHVGELTLLIILARGDLIPLRPPVDTCTMILKITLKITMRYKLTLVNKTVMQKTKGECGDEKPNNLIQISFLLFICVYMCVHVCLCIHMCGVHVPTCV